MPINASNALTLAHQLRVYTAEAASFSDMMDVVYVAQMIQKFLGYVDQIKEVRFSQASGSLGNHLLPLNHSSLSHPSPAPARCDSLPSCPQLVEVMVDMASNLMLVDEHLLWLAQREDKACSGIVGALERIGGAALSPHAQHISVVPWASWEAAPTREAQGGALEMTGVSPSPHHPRASPSVGQPCARFIKNPNMTRVPSRSCGIKFQLVRGSAEEREASDTTEVNQGFVRGTELKGCVIV